jgi:hypothetical protein
MKKNKPINVTHNTRITRFTKKVAPVNQETTQEQNISPEKTLKANDNVPTSALDVMHMKLDHLIQTNKSTEQSLLLLLQEFKTLKADNIKLNEDNIRLSNENLELKDEIRHINKDLSHFESLYDAMEQNLLVKNVEITGVAETENENLIEIIGKISHSVGVLLHDVDIDSIHRKHGNQTSGLPRNIIVKFSRLRTKNVLMEKIKGQKLYNNIIDPGSNNLRPIYFNDHLTSRSKYLFFLARKFKREGHVKYAWTNFGKIFIKKDDNSQTNCVNDINIFAEDNFNNSNTNTSNQE